MLHLYNLIPLFVAFSSTASAELYKLRTSLPGNAVDNQPINSYGRVLSTGSSNPSTYCPTVVNPNCPNNTVGGTIFAGLLGVYVMVPGGQQVYVTPEGAIGLTQAHSAYVPPGSYYGGWTYTYINDRKLITWESPDKSSRGVLACSKTPASAGAPASHQVFAKVPGFSQTGCVELDGLTAEDLPDDTPIQVWQYI